MREVNTKVHSSGFKLNRYVGEWELSQLLFTDEKALIKDKEVKVRYLVTKFDRICYQKKLQANVLKNKAIKYEKT